ncbi:hypothetical protein [Atlantibacter hermannii]|uniref:hypothetical protein n=1 Tax=Atlantibacter hermannii TaxID=565 RepID=UPI0028A84B71|nr:hypothetical protein [Atlantibacter hermannii]
MSQFLQLVDRPIAFQRAFVRLGAGITGALFLSQIVYWQNRMQGQWFYKTQLDLEEETGLTRYEQEGARKKLVSCGVLEESKRGIPAKLYFRVNADRLEEILMGHNQQAGMGKTNNQGCGISPSSDAENQQAGMGKTNEQLCGISASIHTVDYQETTQEITTEIKPSGASAEADTPPQKIKTEYSPEFEEAWRLYPKRNGGNSKQAAFKAWNARIKQGVSSQVMLEGIKRYAAFIRTEAREGTSYVKQACTFLGPDAHFEEEWTITKPASGAQHTNSTGYPSWYTPSSDGSGEVFINQAAIERMKRGDYRT